MTKKEQIKELQEQVRNINTEINELYKKWIQMKYGTKEYKQTFKEIKRLTVKTYEPIYQIELLKGIIYHEDEWITKIYAESHESLEDARKKLLEKLSKLDGVKIINNGSGVKVIEVLTRYKIYRYSIHAHYCSEVIGTKEILDDWAITMEGAPEGTTKTEEIRGLVYCAWCDKNTFNALRNKYYWEDGSENESENNIK